MVSLLLNGSPLQGKEDLGGVSGPEGAWKGQAIPMQRLQEPPLPPGIIKNFPVPNTQLFSFQSISCSLPGPILNLRSKAHEKH